MFRDRIDAGRRLAPELEKYRSEDPIILAIPRGGVVVGAEAADILGYDFDLVVPRKIGAPGNPELAIGAVAGEGRVIIDDRLVSRLGVDQDYLDSEIARQLEEVERRRRRYGVTGEGASLKGRTVIIVDDGLATGLTAKAAVRAVSAMNPAKLVFAVPVGPVDSVRGLGKEVDELICLSTPEPFFAVGQFYREFDPVDDAEVSKTLSKHRGA